LKRLLTAFHQKTFEVIKVKVFARDILCDRDEETDKEKDDNQGEKSDTVLESALDLRTGCGIDIFFLIPIVFY